MNRRLLVGCGMAVFALAAAPSACNRGPAAPMSLSGITGSVPVRLAIEGPRSVPPGETARFIATAHFGDGSTRDVTSQTTWRSDRSSVLSITAPGLALGHEPGESNLSAAFERLASTTEVIVTPAGTFRLTGRVVEADSPNVPVSQAAVEVSVGSPAGLATTSGQDGRYRLYGVPSPTQVRVRKSGYRDHVEAVTFSDHLALDFELALAAPRLEIAGTYTLRITAAPGCAVQLPEQTRTRSYAAVVTQTGPRVHVRMSGPSFVLVKGSQGNSFVGRIDPDGVIFTLTQYDSYYKGYGQPYGDIVEEIVAGSMYLVIDGSVTAKASASGLSGRLKGSFQVFDGDPRWGPRRIARCAADDHQFELVR